LFLGFEAPVHLPAPGLLLVGIRGRILIILAIRGRIGASNGELIDMSYFVGLINAAKDRRCETVSGLREIGSLQ
jgi:hypothetical protein